MKPIRCERSYELEAPPERVWPILADTERFNRSIGLPPTVAVPAGREPVRVATVRARMLGLSLEWDEDPFEFVEGQFYFVRRRLKRGPLREFNGGMRFERLPSGTRLIVQSEFVPRGEVGGLLVRALWRKTCRDCDRLLRRVRSHLREEQATVFGSGVDVAPAGQQEAVRVRLRACPATLAAEPLFPRLADHLATAADPDLTRLRPFVLATQWGADRYDVLRLCLRAAWHGVLDHSWDLLCPNCRGTAGRWSRLEQVDTSAHCDDCRIRFDANFDRAVEVTFKPNPRYRALDEAIYCSGGPRNTPHLIAQTTLAPGAERAWRVELVPGRYRLRNLPADKELVLFVDNDGTRASLAAEVGDGGISGPEGGDLLAAGSVALSVANRCEERQQIVLERLGATEDLVTAAVVSVYQEFRDLFSREVLSPDAQLGIRTLPLLFTDLRGSTALYQRLGNATAYALVRDHFRLQQEVIAAHHGAVIKTIGDAVMAAFPTAAEALACALCIQRDLAQFNRTAAEPLRLKIGLHQGPCIAVRSFEERLDYFGSTVNLAARTHQEATGDDVVTTAAILDDPAVAPLLSDVTIQPFVAELRGIGETRLFRLRQPGIPPNDGRDAG